MSPFWIGVCVGAVAGLLAGAVVVTIMFRNMDLRGLNL